MSRAVICPVCNGSGKYHEKTCHGCHGSGWVEIENHPIPVERKIPMIRYDSLMRWQE